MLRGALLNARRWLLRPLHNQLERLLLEQGRLQARSQPRGPVDDLAQVEFGVFSQNGEDGVIQYLLAQVAVADRSFVEFGVQDYRESNTRFLLQKDHWRGWIIDGGAEHLRYVRHQSFLGDADLQAVQAFITRDNIDGLLTGHGVPADLGLLSVDIDGNDYWVFEAIRSVKPRVLVMEYNSLLGPDLDLSVPYAADFVREAQGPGRFYFGASLTALARLAGERGYALVGCESRGGNAFFVRRDLLGALTEPSPAQAWRSLAQGPGLRYPQALRGIRERPLVDPRSGKTDSIGAWYGL